MIKHRKLIYTALVISIFVNILFVGYFANKVYRNYVLSKSMYYDTSRLPTFAYWSNRDEYYEKLPNDTNEVVFLGDSKTQAFEVSEHFRNFNVKNRGINSDHTLGLLKRMPEILEAYPRKVFIEIGVNDLLRGFGVQTTKNNYLKIINAIQKYSPNTRIYIQSIMPCNWEIFNSSQNVFPQIVDLNNFLEQLSKEKGFTYINLFEEFELNNGLNPEYDCGDGLHISGKGYMKWADIVKPYILEN